MILQQLLDGKLVFGQYNLPYIFVLFDGQRQSIIVAHSTHNNFDKVKYIHE